MKRMLLLVAALLFLCVVSRPQVKPCCAITALDPRAATVTAKENGTSRTFVFKVPDAKLFATVHVGTPVYANFSTKQVSLDGRSVCCQIIRTNTPSAASRQLQCSSWPGRLLGVIPSRASFCGWPSRPPETIAWQSGQYATSMASYLILPRVRLN